MMEKLYMEGQKYSPSVDFDPIKNILEISGSSYPENTFKFFEPVTSWLNSYLKTKGRSITLNFKMIHFNSSSALFFLELLKQLEHYQDDADGKVNVNWYYKRNDPDMLEIGEDYEMDTDLKIKFIAYD